MLYRMLQNNQGLRLCGPTVNLRRRRNILDDYVSRSLALGAASGSWWLRDPSGTGPKRQFFAKFTQSFLEDGRRRKRPVPLRVARRAPFSLARNKYCLTRGLRVRVNP